MVKRKQQIIFAGSGLNSDNSHEFFPVGDSYANISDGTGRRNVIPSPADSDVLTVALGNEHIDDTFVHSNYIRNLKTLGSCEDTENDKIYYFVLGDTVTQTTRYLNSIIEFDPVAETFTKVLFDESALEFDPDEYIKDARFVDGWIYYNGFSYGPKKVNITLAKNYTALSAWVSGGTYVIGNIVRVDDGRTYIAITDHDSETTDPRSDVTNWEQHTLYCYPYDSSDGLQAIIFSWMNIPPTEKISFLYGSDTARYVNNVRGKLFQFAYRYKYRYHGYSRTAPISDISLPEDDESIDGEITNDITFNNYIELNVSNADYGSVEYAEIFVREGNDGVWKYVDKLDVGITDYDFYNDKSYEVVDDTMINTIADSLPRQINSIEFLSENVMALGGVTEGFDNPDINVSLTASTEEVALTTAGAGTAEQTVGDLFWQENSGILYNEVETSTFTPEAAQASYYVRITLQKKNPAATVTIDGALEATDVDTAAHFMAKCLDLIGADPQTTFTSGNGSVGGLFVTSNNFWVGTTKDNFDTLLAAGIVTYGEDTSTPPKFTGFKTGADHPFALVYFDEDMRVSSALTNDDCSVYVPTMPEMGVAETETVYTFRSRITWAISHEAPSWAKYYQWFYAGNSSISTFWQYVLDASAGASDSGGYTLLEISPLQNHQTIYPLSRVEPYEWVKGDRVRVLTVAASGSEYGAMVTVLSDLEIIAYDDTAKTLTVQYDATTNTWSADNGSLIEIYRPKTSPTEVYYALSPIYDIEESSGSYYHMGGTQDQTGAQDAEGAFEAGDVYFIGRAFSEGIGGASASKLFLVETPSYSDFYESDSYHYGKINVESNIGEVSLHNIRWSNRYLQETSINGLSTFDALDYVTLPEKNGDIQRIVQVGNTLKVYQDDRTSSVWVGRTEYVDTTGSSNVAFSDKMLGSSNEQVVEYGTINPESVTRNERYVYGIDLLHGVFWRDSANGLFPISGKFVSPEGQMDYAMSEWFKTKCETLIANGRGSIKVITGWDDYLRLLYVTFLDGTDSDNNETIAFHEPSNRWYAFFDLEKTANTPDFLISKSLSPAIIRNIEGDNLVASSGTTILEITAIDGLDVTLNYLPDELINSNLQWYMQSLDNADYNVADPSFDGDYILQTKVTAINVATKTITVSSISGASTSFTVGKQVMFYSPFANYEFVGDQTTEGIITPDALVAWRDFYTQAGPVWYDSSNARYVLLLNARGTGFQVGVAYSTDLETWTIGNSDAPVITNSDHANFANQVYASGNPIELDNGNLGILLTGYDSFNDKHIHYAEVTKDLATITINGTPLIASTDYTAPSFCYFESQYHLICDARTSPLENSVVAHYVSDTIDSGYTLLTNVVGSEYNANDSAWLEGWNDNSVIFVEEGDLYALVSGQARYRMSGVRGNRVTGLMRYDNDAGTWSVANRFAPEIIFPMYFYNIASEDYDWAGGHIGGYLSFLKTGGECYLFLSFLYIAHTYQFSVVKLVDNTADIDSTAIVPTAECFTSYKKKFYAFHQGEIYKQNSLTANRATFFGVKHDVYVDFIFNEVPEEVKVLDAITIHTNGDWSVDEVDIPANGNYPDGMTSLIPSGLFEKREGKLTAAFLRNRKTTSSVASVLDLINGEALRGQAVYIKLKNTDTDAVRLFKVDIEYSISKV
ncbi:MAG: hypothetical protein WC961_07090 [Anaerovoracaceae bacterium]